MKKIALLIALAAATLAASAQQARYQGQVDLGYSVGIGANGTGRVNLHTIHGARIGDYAYAGLGLGVDFYHQLKDDGTGWGELMLPVFVDLKGYYPVNSHFAPFIALDLGYSTGLTKGVSSAGGFLCSPAVGVKHKRFQAQVGYTSQHFSEQGSLGFTTGACQLKLGLTF